MKKKRFKSRKRKKQNNFLATTMLVLAVLMIIFFIWMSKRASITLIPFAEIQTRKIANIVINQSINNQILEEFDENTLYTIIKDNDGKIQSISYNSKIVNELLNKTSYAVQMNLKAVEEGNLNYLDLPSEILVEYDKNNLKKGIIYEIPLGAASNNAFLSNIGPKIPVRFKLVGSVVNDFKTEVVPYGVNTALIKLYIRIEVEEQVIMPLVAKKIVISNDIPIATQIIMGEVPKYYQNGGTFTSPQVTIPVE